MIVRPAAWRSLNVDQPVLDPEGRMWLIAYRRAQDGRAVIGLRDPEGSRQAIEMFVDPDSMVSAVFSDHGGAVHALSQIFALERIG